MTIVVWTEGKGSLCPISCGNAIPRADLVIETYASRAV